MILSKKHFCCQRATFFFLSKDTIVIEVILKKNSSTSFACTLKDTLYLKYAYLLTRFA